MDSQGRSITAAVFLVTALAAVPYSGEPRLTALEYERFGTKSHLSISSGDPSQSDLYGSAAVAVPVRNMQLSLLSSGSAIRNAKILDPAYFFATRTFDRGTLSGGIGYGFNEQKVSAASLVMTCKGPDIAPYTCIDSSLDQLTEVTWMQRHSCILSGNGLLFVRPTTAFVGGIEAVYAPIHGFRFTENSTAGLIAIHDFDHDAYESELALTAGVWRKELLFMRHWSHLLRFTGDFTRFSSTPLYNGPVTAYALHGNPDYPTIQYTGESRFSYRLLLDYSIGDDDPDRLFSTFNKKPPLSRPQLSIDNIRLYAFYRYASLTRIAVNRWTDDQGAVEYAKTFHYYRSALFSGGGELTSRLYFLRYMYVQAHGNIQYVSDKDHIRIDTYGTAGIGMRFIIKKYLLADIGGRTSRLYSGSDTSGKTKLRISGAQVTVTVLHSGWK